MFEDLLLDEPDSAAILSKGSNFAFLPVNQILQFSCVQIKLGILRGFEE